MMENIDIWLDGEFVSRDDASVSVFDHGLLYGDGVFEGIRVYDNVIFKLEEHIERLYKSAKVIQLDIPMKPDEMIQACVESCRKNDVRDGYIRLVVTRGIGDLGLDPDKCPDPTIFIIAADIELYPEEIYEKGLELVTVPTRRNPTEAINPRVKSLNYLNNIMAKMEAKQAGVEEGIMLNEEGYVVECTGDNIFIVEPDQVIRTPPPHMGVLEGITRDSMMKIAEAEGYEVREEPLNRYDLYVADEIFVTGTAAEALPVVSVDEREIHGGEPGPVADTLIKHFREFVGEHGTVI
ncbi:MAG: branched-chain-amino-acid transaminase [bacterium]